MKIEIYINNKLCDLDMSGFSLRFIKRFIEPSDLNTKDAQRSYNITFPATPRNNEIFGHINIEEVGNKFVKIYDNSRVYVDSIKVFEGKFRLSEITQRSYKGNLGIPAAVSVSDVFGDTVMNQAGTWPIDLVGIEDMTKFNTGQYDKSKYGEIAPCIFPLVLYGLLPKYTESAYTPKNVYDESVRLGLDDFPPSVNVIKMLEQLFSNAGYDLAGTAVNDERIRNLYVSYRNPNDYEMPWPYGSIRLDGSWKTLRNSVRDTKMKIITDGRQRSVVNFFDSINNSIDAKNDSGNYVSNDGNRTTLIIPASGLYKLRFHATYVMLSGETSDSVRINIKEGTMDSVHTEIKILRNFTDGLDSVVFDNKFYYDNIVQSVGDSDAVFPIQHEVNFIDPKQNKDIICGFAFGKYGQDEYTNPLDTDYCNPMAISGGRSWSIATEDGTTDRSYSAVQCSGYQKTDGSTAGRFKVDLNKNTAAYRDTNQLASGDVYQVVYLEKGDRLDIVSTSFVDGNGISISPYILYNYSVNYILELEPFQHNIAWLKIDNSGKSTEAMNWGDDSTFTEGVMDLIKFLPSEIKVNDWIDNFCKAFNLILESKGNTFELNIKNKDTVTRLTNIIDLDKRANVYYRTNQSLGLPYMYNIGFTIDSSEQGYIESMEVDGDGARIVNSGYTGGGQFYTGSYETNKIEQTSSFSYNWFKPLYANEEDANIGENVFISVPVISDGEIWENDYDYKDMLSKLYLNSAQRFWYHSGVKELTLNLNDTAQIALVSNSYSGAKKLTLNYENVEGSILKSFFFLLTNNRNYTTIDCYLTPEEYNALSNSLVKFNGDLYNVAEINGYDPTNRNAGTLALIRRII